MPDTETLQDWIDLTLAEVGAGAERSREVTVRVVDDEEGRALNRRYRGAERATNVLSFPAASPDAFKTLANDEPLPLGDLVLCGPLVAREAAEQGKSLRSHWGHLVVHGTLHLLGYDHEREAEAREMEALEIRILARRGIDDPYRERDSA